MTIADSPLAVRLRTIKPLRPPADQSCVDQADRTEKVHLADINAVVAEDGHRCLRRYRPMIALAAGGAQTRAR
jgi:hypothetical protein